MLKNISLLVVLFFASIVIVSCKTTEATTKETTRVSQNEPAKPSVQTPSANPVKRPNIPLKTIRGNGYTIEMPTSWQGQASQTAGQENVFIVSDYPGLITNYNGSRVLATVFVNRLRSTSTSYLNDFLRGYPEFTVVDQRRVNDAYFIIMTLKGDRNSLRYVKLQYHAELQQALAYNLTLRVIGNEQTYRSANQVDAVAQEILGLFTLT